MLIAFALLAVVNTADVLIQAGHEGRPDCDREPARLCNNTGARGEIDWTPVVADEATRVLRAAGIRVLREPAYLPGTYRVKTAVFIHFDGSVQPCGSRASVGYPSNDPSSRELAGAWKAAYGRFWPYGFEPDNFTSHLGGYYGFRHVTAPLGKFVLEGGEITCPAQHAWLAERLRWEGALLAYVLGERIGRRVSFPPAVSLR